ncbi:hypothetical protein SDC9_194308 [bioreactor metagenome]|uniref:Uncharacterized protein n=1 Tax=bioreactor metagenome TaxID=1076179 RepID=A0A645I5X6_9ZZZZ
MGIGTFFGGVVKSVTDSITVEGNLRKQLSKELEDQLDRILPFLSRKLIDTLDNKSVFLDLSVSIQELEVAYTGVWAGETFSDRLKIDMSRRMRETVKTNENRRGDLINRIKRAELTMNANGEAHLNEIDFAEIKRICLMNFGAEIKSVEFKYQINGKLIY